MDLSLTQLIADIWTWMASPDLIQARYTVDAAATVSVLLVVVGMATLRQSKDRPFFPPVIYRIFGASIIAYAFYILVIAISWSRLKQATEYMEIFTILADSLR